MLQQPLLGMMQASASHVTGIIIHIYELCVEPIIRLRRNSIVYLCIRRTRVRLGDMLQQPLLGMMQALGSHVTASSYTYMSSVFSLY